MIRPVSRLFPRRRGRISGCPPGFSGYESAIKCGRDAISYPVTSTPSFVFCAETVMSTPPTPSLSRLPGERAHPGGEGPWKIAVMGAGAVGCYYGALLARAGHEVVLIGRAAHVQAIQREG